ncbi:MAG: hypothetical protein NVS2B9_11360 [Myxococcales bacterium]
MAGGDEIDKRAHAEVSARQEPPVVARLIVEIRSDGTRTIARGMAEDVARGERVVVDAAGATPLQLALSLLRSLSDIPALGRSFASSLLGPRRKR